MECEICEYLDIEMKYGLFVPRGMAMTMASA